MALVVAIGIVAIVAVFFYLGTAALKDNTQTLLQGRILLAQTTARSIDYLLDSVKNVLTAAAAEEDWSDAGNIDQALEHVSHRLAFYSTQIFLLDRSSHVIAARPPLTSPVSFEGYASIAAALNGQSFAVSRFVHPLGGTGSSTVAVTPVYDRSGNLIGTLVTSINLTSPSIRIFTDPIGLGETGYMDLVDLKGVILASTRPERVGLPGDHDEGLRGMISDHRPVVASCHDCHTGASTSQPRPEVLAFAPLDRAQWGVAVHQSEEEVFRGTRLLQFRIFGFAAAMLAGGLILAYLASRSVIRPVQALIGATQRLAEGDLDTPLAVRGQDEISTLAKSFDSMRTRLRDTISEIKAWNRDLDQRVQEQTAVCRQALEKNSVLLAELQHKEKLRCELLHRVISAQEEERKRISRELHDETCQMITALAYKLDDAAEVAVTPEIHELLEQMHVMAETTQEELHRIIMDLRPTILDHLGLVPALRWYAEKRFADLRIRSNIRVLGRVNRLPPAVEITLFRVVQEAVNNIARHSRARVADFDFEFFDDRVEVRVTDNGVGFDAASVQDGANGHRGLGLMGMAERMSTIDGEFHVRSTPGEGTTIELVARQDVENGEDTHSSSG